MLRSVHGKDCVIPGEAKERTHMGERPLCSCAIPIFTAVHLSVPISIPLLMKLGLNKPDSGADQIFLL